MGFFFFGIRWVGMGAGLFDGWRMFRVRKDVRCLLRGKGVVLRPLLGRMGFRDGEIARGRYSFKF